MSGSVPMKRYAFIRRSFDKGIENTSSGSGHSININAGNGGSAHICQHCGKDCGGHHHCASGRPSKPAWLVILMFTIKIIVVAFFVVVVIGASVYVYNAGCDKCYKLGYKQGYWDALDPFSSGLLGREITPEGGPCRRWMEGRCVETENAQQAMRWSRYYLARGDAEIALVSVFGYPNEDEYSRRRRDAALKYYHSAIAIGSGVGAQASIYAAKRIQYQSMSCTYDQESLSRISRDWEKNTLGDIIEMKQKQEALGALGHYSGPADDRHSPEVRAGIRAFQNDLGFDQTGVLSAEQTVLLICAGAQIAKGIGSQNVLGIMYATGLGVRQNTDSALNWLEIAAQRGDADAQWNLAMMYGTQTVLSSVLICDAVQNAERADSYLFEAAKLGHPVASVVYEKYQDKAPDVRWRMISGDLNLPEAVNRVGRGCNP